MVLSNKYQNQESAIASYNYTDIASGTGYSVFYGASVSGATILIPNAIYSNDIVFRTGNITTSANAERIEKDFDVKFNRPQTLKGAMIINCPIGMRSNQAASEGSSRVDLSLSKIRGGVTTFLVSGSSAVFNTGATADNIMKDTMTAVRLEMPTTAIANGDTLRLNVRQWGSVGDGTIVFGFGCDPAGRDDPAIALGTDDGVINSGNPTDLRVYVPFVVDV